ncbi:MAG: dihydroxy-acid dehydratase, partial [Methylococcus sp.]
SVLERLPGHDIQGAYAQFQEFQHLRAGAFAVELFVGGDGPKGGPGMREMLSPTSAVMGKGLAKDVALITDGRFSGGTHGFVVGHITPEAYTGGPLAIVQDGDGITIDAEQAEITLHISEEEIRQRLAAWKRPAPRYTRGVLAKFAKLAASASEGAVTDKHLGDL